MNFLGDMIESNKLEKNMETETQSVDKQCSDKFDHLMGDHRIEHTSCEDFVNENSNFMDIENKFDRLFDSGDFFDEADIHAALDPDIEYTRNDNTYKTDEEGRIIDCDSKPQYTEDGHRNTKEQKEAGGEDRQEDDDGGHIVARVLGGSEGEENLVPMRRTVNRGDYKRMENEISKALQEGKDVQLHVELEYEDDSKRPSKMRAEYTIDHKTVVCEFDNVQDSTDLLDSLKNKISDEDYDRLSNTIRDMREDGCEVSITSVKVEYDENGQTSKVTVGMLNESDGTKQYKQYQPR